MKLSLFDGGLNTRLDPRLVPQTESVVNTNVDMSSGIIRPEKLPLVTELALKPFAHFYEKDQEWVSFDEETHFLEFQDTLYYVRDGVAYKYRDGEENLLGIQPPTTAPQVSALYQGIKWAGLASNNKDTPDNIVVAIGNKNDKEWSHTVTMTSVDKGETWNIREHEDNDTQWLSLAYCALDDEFIATGQAKEDLNNACWLSATGEDWEAIRFTVTPALATTKKIWNLWPREYLSGPANAYRYGCLVELENGDVYSVLLSRVATAIEDVQGYKALLCTNWQLMEANTSSFFVAESSASARVMVAVNGTQTLQHSTDLFTGWTSYTQATSPGTGWKQVTNSYHLPDLADRWMIASGSQVMVSTTGATSSWSSMWSVATSPTVLLNVTAVSYCSFPQPQQNCFFGLENGVIARHTSGYATSFDFEYEFSPLQSKIIALGETAEGTFAVDEAGYIAVRDANQIWKGYPLNLGKVKFAVVDYDKGLAIATEDGKLYHSLTGFTFEEIAVEGELTDLCWPQGNYLCWATTDQIVYGLDLSDKETIAVDLSSENVVSSDIKLAIYGSIGLIAYSTNVSQTGTQYGIAIDISDSWNISPILVGQIAGANFIAKVMHSSQNGTTYRYTILTADNTNFTLYHVQTGDTETFTASFLIGGAFVPTLTDRFIVFTNRGTFKVFGSAGPFVESQFYLGTEPGPFVRMADHTMLLFKHSNRVMVPTSFAPYYAIDSYGYHPYESANRGHTLAVSTSGTLAVTGVALSSLPSPKFVLKMNSSVQTIWEHFKAGDEVYKYQWVYTYYNDSDGTESVPTPISIEVSDADLGNSAVSIPLLSSPDPQVTHIRLYRIGGQQTEFTLIAELPNADQIYGEYLLSPSSSVLLTSDNNYPPPTGLRFLSYYGGRFFSIQGLQLVYTDEEVNPNYWPPENSIALTAESTGLAVTAVGLYVFTSRTIQLLSGQGILDFLLTGVSQEIGTTFSFTLVVKDNTILFVNEKGVFQLSGLNVERISRTQLSDNTVFNAVNAELFNDQYIIQLEDGRCLLLDLRYIPVWRHIDFDTSRIITGNGKLLAIKDDDTVELFKGEDSSELIFKSPRYTEGSVTILKSYNILYIASSGQLTLSVWIDGSLVLDEYSLQETYVQEVQIPVSCRRGYDIQLEFKGTGEVYEVEYLPKARDKQ